MAKNELFQHVLDKNFVSLSQSLSTLPPEALLEVDEVGNTFKTLAIKTLTNAEFEEFCTIMQHYYESLSPLRKQKYEVETHECKASLGATNIIDAILV